MIWFLLLLPFALAAYCAWSLKRKTRLRLRALPDESLSHLLTVHIHAVEQGTARIGDVALLKLLTAEGERRAQEMAT